MLHIKPELETDIYIQTVLKGETLGIRDRLFTKNGTGRATTYGNAKALDLWLRQLKSEADNQPLEWIKQMTTDAPNERITAANLMDQIYSYEGDYMYYNSCCNGEEGSEDETSYKGSVVEVDATSTKYFQNSTKACIDDGSPSVVAPTSSRDSNTVFTQRQALSLRPLSSTNQTGLEAGFQHPDAVSESAITDAKATQLLLKHGFNIHTTSSN